MVTMTTAAGPEFSRSGPDGSGAAELPGEEVLRELGVDQDGLDPGEAERRLARYGPNAVSTHRVRLLLVLWRQVRSPLLGLLLAAAIASYFVGQRSDAVIIGVIVALSVGLGFVNEYRAERAADTLHSQIHHQALAIRGGRPVAVDVTALVPGDLVDLRLGDIVPADIRLLRVSGLECDESVLTGESLPVEKATGPVAAGTPLAERSSCALMGTVVHAGSGRGVVTATGARTHFGAIAAGLGAHETHTQFQVGLRRFSLLLVYVAGALTASIFATNLVLHRPILDALLFSLAIAVGITPQLLPAVVSMMQRWPQRFTATSVCPAGRC
jgi:P-type Mg2+ transporter